MSTLGKTHIGVPIIINLIKQKQYYSFSMSYEEERS